MLAAVTAAGCGASRGASELPTPDEVEELADQFNHDLFECVVDLGVEAKIVGDGIELVPGAIGDGQEFEDCTDRLLQESRYAFMNNAP
jgi:hypothetical protein